LVDRAQPDDVGGPAAWVLIDDGEVSRFGPALAWATSAGATEVHVIVEESVPGGAGVIARRSTQFAANLTVWRASGRELLRAQPPATDGSPSDPAGSSPLEDEIASLLEAHGAVPVVEHGVLRGEVLGLEVARVVAGRLVVGVGRHDRHARSEMRPGEDLASALDEAVEAVRRWRRHGVVRHPANTLARGRWLRATVCSRPSLAGLESLEPVAPPLPWFDLPEAGSAPGVGTRPDGSRAVVVCSTGVDLDLVPTAADCRLLYGSAGESLLLVVPAGDDLPVTRRLAAMLANPAEVVPVAPGWESLSGELSAST